MLYIYTSVRDFVIFDRKNEAACRANCLVKMTDNAGEPDGPQSKSLRLIGCPQQIRHCVMVSVYDGVSLYCSSLQPKAESAIG